MHFLPCCLSEISNVGVKGTKFYSMGIPGYLDLSELE